VDQGEVGRVPVVRQVGEERLDLRRRQHPLVDDGARGERGEVDVDFVLGPLAQAEGHPVEGQAGLARLPGDEQLGQVGQRLAGALAAGGLLDRDIAPAEDRQPLVGGQVGDPRAGRGAFIGIVGQEGHADGIVARCWQAETDDLPEERVRQLGQDAGTVTGVRIRAGRAPVLQIAEHAQRARYHVVAAPSGQVGDKTNAAGVMFETAVV